MLYQILTAISRTSVPVWLHRSTSDRTLRAICVMKNFSLTAALYGCNRGSVHRHAISPLHHLESAGMERVLGPEVPWHLRGELVRPCLNKMHNQWNLLVSDLGSPAPPSISLLNSLCPTDYPIRRAGDGMSALSRGPASAPMRRPRRRCSLPPP